jgi:hypothetical protein
VFIQVGCSTLFCYGLILKKDGDVLSARRSCPPLQGMHGGCSGVVRHVATLLMSFAKRRQPSWHRSTAETQGVISKRLKYCQQCLYNSNFVASAAAAAAAAAACCSLRPTCIAWPVSRQQQTQQGAASASLAPHSTHTWRQHTGMAGEQGPCANLCCLSCLWLADACACNSAGAVQCSYRPCPCLIAAYSTLPRNLSCMWCWAPLRYLWWP